MTLFHDDGQVKLLQGDVRAVLRDLPADSVNCVVTSPPYWSLRDYGVEPSVWADGTRIALGLEPTPELFVGHMVDVFREVRRVLRDDGVLFLNIGDSYASQGGQRAYGSFDGATGRGPQPERVGVPRGERNGRSDTASPDSLKPKDLVGIPWMLAFALRTDGWWLRQDIIWSKPNPMPESVKDRCTKAHEYLFLLSKRERYWSDFGAIREPVSSDTHARSRKLRATGNEASMPTKERNGVRPPGVGPKAAAANSGVRYNESFAAAVVDVLDDRNKRSVWHIPMAPFPEAHFATFPPALVEPCILAGCPEGGTVLDPFVGSGTTAMVARQLGRKAIGIDLNPEYLAMAVRRVGAQKTMFAVKGKR